MDAQSVRLAGRSATIVVSQLSIRPDLLRQFGARDGASFELVVTPELLPHVALDAPTAYRAHALRTLPPATSLARFIEDVPQDAHVLVIVPGRVVTSPDTVGRRKVLVVPCGSTPSSLASIAAGLRAAQESDPRAQDRRAERFFEAIGDAERLEIVDQARGTHAVFDHRDGTYAWNAQLGFVGWGEQQIAPAGEIDVMPANIMTFEPQRRLALTGSLTVVGEPIVHCGSARDAAHQARLYRRLVALRHAPLAIDVEAGEIRGLRPVSRAAEGAAQALGELFAADRRFRVLWEIGIGLNDRLVPAAENCATNAVYGGDGGRVHVGLGVTTGTRFALTLACNGSVLRTADGTILAGEPPSSARPRPRIARDDRTADNG